MPLHRKVIFRMDIAQKKRRSLSWNDIIYISIMLIAFAVKFRIFYSQLHLGGFENCFTFVSEAIVLLLVALIGLISPKAARWVLTFVYFFFSIVMGVDGVYFAYVSKLPSAAQIGMVGQLDDISETIKGLIKVRHVLMVIDLPLWVVWALDRGFVRRRTPKTTEKLSEKKVSRFIVSAVLTVIALLLAAYVFFFSAFEPEYLENELFCYHFSDIYKAYFAEPEENTVDKSEYTQNSEAENSDDPMPPVSDPDSNGEDPLKGIAEGRNVIIIQVEAMQGFLIGAEYEGQELMPNLNALIGNDSFYFSNYYYQIGGGNTADAEFGVNNSLFAPESEAAYFKYPDNDYFGLPCLLKANGYSGAHAFHGYIGSFWNREYAYPKQGFDDFHSLEDFDQTLDPTEADTPFGMGISDRSFFRQSLEIMKTYEQPFYSFMITLSSHYPFALPMKARAISLKPEDEATLFGLYIQSMNYADRAIGEFIENLKEAGLYDNSIIVIYGDHYALTNTDATIDEQVKSMLGRRYTIYDVFKVPCIIHIPGSGYTETVEKAGGHLDVLPTLLYLLGIENDKAVMFGSNLLDGGEGLVCEQTHMAIGSFISNDVFFKKPYNNIKTNYDAYEYGTMERLDPDDFEEESRYAASRIGDCRTLLENNDILLDGAKEQNNE